jgi:hypothetical protein
MPYFYYHTANTGRIFVLYDLIKPPKAQGFQCPPLISGVANIALHPGDT